MARLVHHRFPAERARAVHQVVQVVNRRHRKAEEEALAALLLGRLGPVLGAEVRAEATLP